MIRWLIALSMSAGCISIPDEATSVADDAARVDAPPLPDCPQRPIGTPIPATPAIYSAVVADVNMDGCEDLILTHFGRPAGFYVTYGPLNSTNGSLHYHEHVELQIIPYAITVSNVLGSSAPDILLFGLGDPDGAGEGRIEVFETGSGTGNLYSTSADDTIVTSFRPQFDTVPGDTPTNIVVGDFNGDGESLDIAISDLDQLALLITPTGGSFNLSSAQPTVIGPSGNNGLDWRNINKLFVSSTPEDGDDLIVAELEFLTRIRANQLPIEVSRSGTSNLQIQSGQLYDLDGIPPLDIVVGGFNTFGAYVLSDSNFTVMQTNDQNIPSPIWQLSILPTATEPMLITFERLGPPQTGDILYRPLQFSNGSFSTVVPTRTSPGISGIVAVVADLDNDGVTEYRLISDNGQSRCYVPNGDSLVLCP